MQEQLPSWDLSSDLYHGIDDPRIEKDLAWVLSEAKNFEERYRGKIVADMLTGIFLQEIMQKLEAIYDTIHKIQAYAYLIFAENTKKFGPFLQKIKERVTEINKYILFAELDWRKIPQEDALRILAEEACSRFRYYLKHELDYSKHSLSEPEEKILSEKDNTGAEAFGRLFDETINNIQFDFAKGKRTKKLTEPQILQLQYSPNRNIRKAAVKSLAQGLRQNKHLITYIFNVLAQDKANSDRLRKYSSFMEARNIANDIDEKTVDGLLEAVQEGYSTVHRYYRLKSRVHGFRLADCDRYAPLPAPKNKFEKYISYAEAKAIILQAFGSFSPRMSEIANMFFEKNWIDAEPKESKQGGAFSHSVTPSVHPYILTNYFGGPRDVMTLAHELGHGIHQYLSRDQGIFHAHTPLTTAETASVFGEMLVFDSLMKRFTDPRERFSLLMDKLADIFATVARQVALTQFEKYMHEARRSEGELPTERFNELWMEANRPMFGNSLTLTKDYAWLWMCIPHFIHSSFYCYAYSFGELLVFSLYHKYLQEGESFASRYVELLKAGGSKAPHELIYDTVGLDITHSDFWSQGISLLEEMVTEAETLWDEIKNT